MGEKKFAIGVDFGTESGRAVLVDVQNGREIATAQAPRSFGVWRSEIKETQSPLPAIAAGGGLTAATAEGAMYRTR